MRSQVHQAQDYFRILATQLLANEDRLDGVQPTSHVALLLSEHRPRCRPQWRQGVTNLHP